MQSHYTTDTIHHPLVPAGFAPAIFPMSRGCPAARTTGLTNTPTRIRTRNASFEARYDRPFHHRGVERKARESNPHLRWENRLSRAARPTVSGYLPKVDPPGIEPAASTFTASHAIPLHHGHHQPLVPAGFEPAISTMSGWRALRCPTRLCGL